MDRSYMHHLGRLAQLSRRVHLPCQSEEESVERFESLGAGLQQHEAALDLALQQDKPAAAVSLPLGSAKDAADIVRQVDQAMAATRGKTDAAALRTLLTLNLQLERLTAEAEPIISRHHVDLLQRKLATVLPATTKLSSQPQADAAALQQLRSRCALAKGRHIVEYSGHGAAAHLLTLLADQNLPAIKAVLRLPQQPAIKTRCHQQDCRGEFEVNFDVRGRFIPQLFGQMPAIDIPDVGAADVFGLAAHAEMQLRRNWDTAALAAPLAGTSPALALEVCSLVLQRLQRDDQGACVIVRRDTRPGAEPGMLLTLAFTDSYRKGMRLVNSTHVVKRAAEGSEHARDPSLDLLERLQAAHLGCTAVVQRLCRRKELTSSDSLIASMMHEVRGMGTLNSRLAFDYGLGNSGLEDLD